MAQRILRKEAKAIFGSQFVDVYKSLTRDNQFGWIVRLTGDQEIFLAESKKCAFEQLDKLRNTKSSLNIDMRG